MTAGSREAFDHHVGKWRHREPEMALSEVFCPANDRLRFNAWGALLFELREAMFELSDARVTAVKTGWWAETLMALEKGQGRHPLTEPFSSIVAPWSALARSVIETPQGEVRPGNVEAAIDKMQPLASAAAEVEAAIFGVAHQPDSTRALAVHWLLHRLPSGLGADDVGLIPMNLLARHAVTASQLAAGQGEAVLRDWASVLSQQLPAGLPQASVFRKLRTRFDRLRLQRLATGRGFSPPAALSSVWQGWLAARNG